MPLVASHAAELMPVATANRQGVLSPGILRNIPQSLVLNPGEAKEIINITSSYLMFVCVLFCTVGSYANHIIISGRSNDSADNISIMLNVIKRQGGLKLYRKNNNFYVYNSNKTDSSIGFVLSSQWLGIGIVKIDDTYTEIAIE